MRRAHEFVALARHVDEHTDLGEVADVLIDQRLFLLHRTPPAPAPAAPTPATPTPTTATTAILGNDGGLPAVLRGTGRMAVPWSEESGAAAPLQAEQEQNGPRHRHVGHACSELRQLQERRGTSADGSRLG